jgi:hypothetical protein
MSLFALFALACGDDTGPPPAAIADGGDADVVDALVDVATGDGSVADVPATDVFDTATSLDGSEKNEAGVPVDVGEACAAWAKAVCVRFERICPPDPSRPIPKISEAACQADAAAHCRGLLSAPGVAETPSQRQACASSLAALDCTGWDEYLVSRTIPDACADRPGLLTEGAGCWSSAQCGAGLSCWLGTRGECGTCRKANGPPAGTRPVCSGDGPACDRGAVCFTFNLDTYCWKYRQYRGACVQPGAICDIDLKNGDDGRCVSRYGDAPPRCP